MWSWYWRPAALTGSTRNCELAIVCAGREGGGASAAARRPASNAGVRNTSEARCSFIGSKESITPAGRNPLRGSGHGWLPWAVATLRDRKENQTLQPEL